jgi:hypothetical protein
MEASAFGWYRTTVIHCQTYYFLKWIFKDFLRYGQFDSVNQIIKLSDVNKQLLVLR